MKGKRATKETDLVVRKRKRASRRTTAWTDAALLDFGEWLRVRTLLSGLKSNEATRRTLALSGKEKPPGSRRSRAKVVKPEPTSRPNPSPETLVANATELIENVEHLEAIYAQEASKLKEIKKDAERMGNKIKRARRQATESAWNDQTTGLGQDQRSLALMEDELARLTRRAAAKEGRVRRLRLDIKINRYDAKMLFNSAERIRRSRSIINSEKPSGMSMTVMPAFFDLTRDGNDRRELLDSVQWSRIENGRDTSLDEVRVRAIVRAFSRQGDGSIETNMEEARAILDPRRAFAEALSEMRRRHGSEFSDCFTKQERKVIYRFKKLRATRRHLLANLINAIFDAPFEHYAAGVNWIGEWMKEEVSTPKNSTGRLSARNPSRTKPGVAPASSYTHNFGLWLRAMRERSRLTLEGAVLLAEILEGRA
ncbi:MAG: hypothetical protein H7Z38_15775, partial [Rubrivivax sp.]|nr:hypothetical protein [Pyrinomonadaceae bacterium]